mmetsp:Transcript_39077/g.63151  ORF Transcript_39077/g.63151 Transcript_39077/m.63151 type:complete len:200 (+) Transcript_39077:79-678(+)
MACHTATLLVSACAAAAAGGLVFVQPSLPKGSFSPAQASRSLQEQATFAGIEDAAAYEGNDAFGVSKGLLLGLALGLVMGLATAVAPVRAAEAAKPVEAPTSCDVRKGCTREQQLAWGKMMAQKYNNYEKGTPPSGTNFTTTDVAGGQQKVEYAELTGGYAGKGLQERLKPFIVDNKAVWKGNVWDNPLWQPGPYTKFK